MTVPTPSDWFKFEETSGTAFTNEISHVPDRNGVGNSATYFIPGSHGLFGYGVRCDGNGYVTNPGYMAINNSSAGSDFDWQGNNFSIGVDFFVETAADYNLFYLFSQGYGAGAARLFDVSFSGANTYPTIRLQTSISTIHSINLTDFDRSNPDHRDVWHRLIVVKDGTTVRAYLNGAKVATYTHAELATLKAMTSQPYCGVGNGSPAFHAYHLDNLVHWHNTALSDAQVEEFYNLSLLAPYFDFADAAHSPDDLDTGVLTTQTLGIVIEDDNTPIPLADVELRITRNLSEETVYDGDGGGYQAPYTGDTPVANASGRGWKFTSVYRTGGWFEDLDVAVRGLVASVMDESYTFEIETLGYVRNSGVEAPGATAQDAKAWTAGGDDPNVELGTKWGPRLQSPTQWPSPPEGSHVIGLGSDDLTGFSAAATQWVKTTSLDLTDATYIIFNLREVTSVIPPGESWTLNVYVDVDVVYTKTWDDDDDSTDDSSVVIAPASGYTGTKEVKFELVFSG